MILCFGSWNRAGGINTLFQFYYKKMKIEVPHMWALIGNSPVPSLCLNKNTRTFVIAEDWHIYLDSKLCSDINKKIKALVKAKAIKALFLPLEYHLFPFIRGIKLPIFYISHLLNKPLIESLKQQWYSKTPEAQKSLKADQIRLQVEQEVLPLCQYIICNSSVTKNDLLRYYSILKDAKVFVSEPGTLKSYWKDVPFGSKNHALYFGRLTHQKGIPNLMKLKKQNLNITLVGKGRMASLSRHNHISWVEPELLKTYLNRSLFCLFPSHYEPWGLSLNEALAAGKICLAQRGAGGHELQIDNGINGFLVDFNTNSASEKIQEAAKNQKNLKNISQNARSSANDISNHLQFVSQKLTQFHSECL